MDAPRTDSTGDHTSGGSEDIPYSPETDPSNPFYVPDGMKAWPVIFHHPSTQDFDEVKHKPGLIMHILDRQRSSLPPTAVSQYIENNRKSSQGQFSVFTAQLDPAYTLVVQYEDTKGKKGGMKLVHDFVTTASRSLQLKTLFSWMRAPSTVR